MARKRKKKLRRKKEERRETGERERKKRKCFFNERREKSVIKKIYIYIYILTSSYNTQQKIDMYCSSKVKIFSHAFTIVEQFFLFW